MPVLNWIGKDKVVNHDKELPFRVLKPNKKLSVGDENQNLLIEGDNLEALKSLMPFYSGRVNFIYIDPPYNTGNENWVYNDKVNSPKIKEWLGKIVGKESEDLCRHDKWLCMIYPRLKLLYELLSTDGIIFISIGDDEQENLKIVMDEIFGRSNFIATVCRVAKTTSFRGNFFAPSKDYLVGYAKDITQLSKFSDLVDQTQYKKIEIEGSRKGEKYRDDIAFYLSTLETRPNQRYYIECPDGSKVLPPGKTFPPDKPLPGDGVWRWNKTMFDQKKDLIVFKKTTRSPLIDENGKQANWNLYTKSYLNDKLENGNLPRDFLQGFLNRNGTKEVKDLGIKFDFPKPSKLIKYLLTITGSGKEDIILDSFAGSGTTGHAVMDLNKEDGGNRKFILVELEEKVAKDVTSERLKRVIKKNGYKEGFEYLDLNGELYDYSGFINPDAQYEDLAAYIYFTETRNYLDISKISNPLIGSQGSTHYYLLFEGKGKNVLDEKTIKKTEGAKGSRVIYADKCLLDDDNLEKHGITFKQIPYELKKY